MNDIQSGVGILVFTLLFYYYGTTYGRMRDVRTQLHNTLAELKKDSYEIRTGQSNGRTWIELVNPITRIFFAEEDGHEELWLHLFLPNAEQAGANVTHLSRLAIERKPFGKILYQRTNKLSGTLLYYVTGVTRARDVHMLMNELIARTRAHGAPLSEQKTAS
jgi:hypothetical protein